MIPATPNRSHLRQQLRAARRALRPGQQRAAARLLLRRVRGLLPILHARHIACYWPSDGEMDVSLLMHWLCQNGKQVYLPRIYANGQNKVRFLRYGVGDVMEKNRFGIPEPLVRCPARAPWALDVVLMPLVGFDRAGHRLGMGGGFYDRTFAFRRVPGSHRPLLVGVAHSIQEVETLAVFSWDVPLDAIVTDQDVFWLRRVG